MKNFSSPLSSDVHIISHTCLPFSSQFEIDTVRLFIHWLDLQDYDYEYLVHLIDAKESKIGWRGMYRGFTINISNKGITITGSLSNYFKGYADTLAYYELKYAVEKLGSELKLNLHLAKLYRVDVNFNCITDNNVEMYTNDLFTCLSRFKRLEQEEGVRFQTKSLAIEFYNKSKQLLEKKGIEMKDWYRIEFKVKKDVARYTGMRKVEDLYAVENYNKLLGLFYKYYQEVKKQTVTDIHLKEIMTTREYANYLMLKGVEGIGGDKEVYREIEQLDREGRFSNRNQKYRLIKKVKVITSESYMTQIHPLAKELDEKFEKFYRNELIITNNNYGRS